MVFLDILMMVGGLIALIFGADVMIRGISALATRFGVPSIVIGMTVVAFGTSLPEVAVNVFSAFRQETGLAFGNIVGACSINVGWVLALTAIYKPLRVDAIVIRREIPFMILAAATLVVMSLDPQLNGEQQIAGLFRGDGLILLLLFGVFVYYTVIYTLSVQKMDLLVEEARDVGEKIRPLSLWTMMFMIMGGLIGVGAGAQFTVNGAVGIAQRLGVPENIIGLTLISFGTTLPELATCLVAARRNQPEIAIGNIVGSNIFNILFIGGTVATIHPILIPPGGLGDLVLMASLCMLTFPISVGGLRMITRLEGFFLLLVYLSYIIWRVSYV